MAGEIGPPQTPDNQYSSVFAFAYIFNLVIGVGALTLPLAFTQAGIVLGTLLIITLAFLSFMTTSYVIEAMAAANAYDILKEKRDRGSRQNSSIQSQKVDLSMQDSSPNETTPLILPGSIVLNGDSAPYTSGESDDYEINKKYEMGTMANMFYHPVGILFYYLCICIYLYGDLAIYAVTIPKSMGQVLCWERNITHYVANMTNISSEGSGYFSDIFDCDLGNSSGNETFAVQKMCFGSTQINEQDTYYICLAITVFLLCPWTFFNLTRSKYLQLFTTALRNIAFILMIGIAVVDMAVGHTAKHHPAPAKFEGFPVLFGVSIYSFMCQHSLPGMITPMKSKKNVLFMTFADFSLILFSYLLLTYTSAFRFTTLQDLYTLNFFHSSATHITVRVVLGYYLALFPVFTLSTNFPIISITLRENLKALFRALLKRWYGDRDFNFVISRILFPLLAIIPPILIAFATQNVEALVSITGSFPGVGVQYIIPVTLAIAAKRVIQKEFSVNYSNKHRSIFSYWPIFVFVGIWTIVSFLLIIIDDALKIKNGNFI